MSPISVVIAGYARSPFHFARKGALVDIRPDDLAAAVLKGLVEKLDLDPALLEDVVMGCAYPEAEQGMNIARIASFRAGFPQSLGGATLNRFCGSSMSAVHYAAGQVLLGAGEAFIAAGVESMTRVPMGGFNLSPNPALLQDYPAVYMSMGQTAENVAERYAVSRVEQEEMAVRSHAKAVAAREAGLLREEIVAIDTPAGRVAEDGCIRPRRSRAVRAVALGRATAWTFGERVVSADTDEFMVWLPGLAAGVPRASCPIEVFGNVVGWRAAGGRR